MRTHFIKFEEDKNIIYFPETKRFFKANDKAVSLAKSISDNKDLNQILKDLNITEDEYNYYFQKFSEYSKLPEQYYNMDIIEHKESKKFLGRLVIHVTNYCDLKCKYCYANGGNYFSEEKDIDLDTIDKTLSVFYSEFDEIGFIQFFGGEPLLNLDAIEYVCKSVRNLNKNHERATSFGLVTNGVNINERFINLVKEYNIMVTVSYDGNPKINNTLRINSAGVGVTDIILKNSKLLKQETEQPHTIEVTYTKTHIDNGVSIQDVVRHIAKELPNTYIHLVPVGGSSESPYVISDMSVFADSVDEIFESYNKNNGFTYSLAERIFNALSNPMPTSRYICDAGVGTISVSVKGDVYPCFMFTDMEGLKLGNVYEDNLFTNSKFDKMIKKIQNFSDKSENKNCKECFINTSCSGCLGTNNYGSDNLFFLNNDICNMHRNMMERTLINLAYKI